MVSKLVRFLRRHARPILAGVLLLQVVGGSLYSVWLGEEILFADESDYMRLAANLSEARRYSWNGVVPTAFRPPGYPFILSLGHALGAQLVHFRILNFLALATATYLLHRLLRESNQLLGAAISGLLVLGYPVLFYAAGTLFPQTIATTLLLGFLLLIIGRRPSWTKSVVAGLMLGYAILMVPLFLFTSIVIPGYALWKRTPSLGNAIVAVACSVLVFGLWTLRNYLAFDRFVFISSNSGYNLLLGNMPASSPNAGVTEELTEYYFSGGRELGLDEVDRDNHFRAEVVDYLVENPFRAGGFYLLKVLNYFNFRNELRTEGESGALRDFVMLVTYGSLLLLMLTRLVLARRYPLSSFEQLATALYLASALASAVFFTRIRFRLPFDFLLIGTVACFLGQVLNERGATQPQPEGG